MREILTTFLKIGLTAYGGPAILGVMQAEFHERRQWLTKPQVVEAVRHLGIVVDAAGVAVDITYSLGVSRDRQSR